MPEQEVSLLLPDLIRARLGGLERSGKVHK